MKKKDLWFLGILVLGWVLLYLFSMTPQIAFIKHPSPETSQFIYKQNLPLISLSFLCLWALNLALGRLLKSKIFDKINTVVFAFLVLFIGYLLYLNF
ncbi:MAG: hypothetical protein UU76_C0002G0016 [Parcubacteria group bacterium GW2011_GWC1_41_7]|nr:MAG: hypothetical protein UU76_C0002G0016 [Parcubacteria group bacterium GW2011_GWC1_41_7]